jgi:hypothetical protein
MLLPNLVHRRCSDLWHFIRFSSTAVLDADWCPLVSCSGPHPVSVRDISYFLYILCKLSRVMLSIDFPLSCRNYVTAFLREREWWSSLFFPAINFWCWHFQIILFNVSKQISGNFPWGCRNWIDYLNWVIFILVFTNWQHNRPVYTSLKSLLSQSFGLPVPFLLWLVSG